MSTNAISNKERIISLVPMLLAMFLLFACSKEEIEEPELLLYTENIEFDDEGGNVNVVFETNREWKIVLSETWLTVSSQNGVSGVSSIILTADPNKTYQGRSAKVILTCGTLTKEIEVNQKQFDYLELSVSSDTISSDGGVLDLIVMGNIPYEIDIQGTDWIKLLDSSSEGRLSFYVEVNRSLEPRKADIHIFNEEKGISKFFVLEQDQFNVLSVDSTLYAVEYKENSITVVAKSNVKFSVDTSDSWIHLVSDTIDGYMHYMIFSISENQEEEVRNGEILFVFNDMREAISVKQNGMPADITGTGSGYLKK